MLLHVYNSTNYISLCLIFRTDEFIYIFNITLYCYFLHKTHPYNCMKVNEILIDTLRLKYSSKHISYIQNTYYIYIVIVNFCADSAKFWLCFWRYWTTCISWSYFEPIFSTSRSWCSCPVPMICKILIHRTIMFYLISEPSL